MEEEIDMSCVLTCLDMEEEAFYYCAGWLAKNFHNRYAIEELGEVGHPTGRWPVRLGEPARWIAAQSRGNKIGHLVKYMYLNTVHNLLLSGGLICPTHKFVNLIRQFDIVFVSLHGTTISHMEKVIETLKETLCKKFPFLPEPIALKYSRFRTFTR